MKSKIMIALCAASLAVSGCSTNPLKPTKIEYRVAKPDAALFTCEKVLLPNPDTLTDAAVATLINDLVKANKTCANNMNAIKQYLEAAEDVLEKRKS